MKRGLIGLLTCMWACLAMAQQDPVLMRVNGKDVLRSEFEFYCNNKRSDGRPQKTDSYLYSFVAHKMKADVAKASGITANPAFREDQLAFRRQLIKSYLTDEATEEECARQLYERMKSTLYAGEVQVAQIYIHLPQSASSRALQDAQLRMESIYQRLMSDSDVDFETFVQQYSEEKERVWVSWLQFSEEFESIVFSLRKGEVSKPFLTPQGIHIVKVVDQKEFPPFEQIRDKLMRYITRQFQVDKGIDVFVEKLKEAYHFTLDMDGMEELWEKGATSKTLFVLDGNQYTGALFRRFAETHPMGTKKQFDAFVKKSVLDYENSKLEEKHPDFNLKLQEYGEQVLVSSVSDPEVHKVTLSDSVALEQFFNEHRLNYGWKTPRYKGAVLYGINKKLVKKARNLLKELPPYMWEDAIRLNINFSSNIPLVHIEQGVFAEGDNEFIDKIVFKKEATALTKSYPFTAVVGEKQKGPVYYKEIIDELIDDYQNNLDMQWVERLLASGKVEINQEVLKTVNYH